ncbi:unnamed protein product [Rodentolepis nana]|uniref:Coiled-coil domain-containing protein n=1 Tax=Rodentolepis nana TaxID=102285 RepID=A0A0R3TMY2_RODNA|nr:unnamed protein product [Rodentolepis nana]
MYNLQKNLNTYPAKVDEIDSPKEAIGTFTVSKSVRISDETFYFGSTQSESVSKGLTSGKESPDSTYFSSVTSDTCEGGESGKIGTVSVDKEQNEFERDRSLNVLSLPALRIAHTRTQSDSLFISSNVTSQIDTSSPITHKHRLASENSAPILKAAELHHNLLNLRLHLNGLYAERHKLQKELDATLMQPPNRQHLLELREKFAQESEKTSHLLRLAVKAKQDALNPESLDDIANLVKRYQERRQEVVDQRIKSLEEQVEILKQSNVSKIFLYNLLIKT